MGLGGPEDGETGEGYERGVSAKEDENVSMGLRENRIGDLLSS